MKKHLEQVRSTTLNVAAIARSFLTLGVAGVLTGVLGQVTSVEGIRELGAIAVLIGTGIGCVLTLIADHHDRSPAVNNTPTDALTDATSLAVS